MSRFITDAEIVSRRAGIAAPPAPRWPGIAWGFVAGAVATLAIMGVW
jgi:hypothetical protein